VYDYITTLYRIQAEVILNHVNPNVNPFVEDEAPFRNTYVSRRESISWSWISRRLKPGMTVLAKPAAI
jgi:hypothetical protein